MLPLSFYQPNPRGIEQPQGIQIIGTSAFCSPMEAGEEHATVVSVDSADKFAAAHMIAKMNGGFERLVRGANSTTVEDRHDAALCNGAGIDHCAVCGGEYLLPVGGGEINAAMSRIPVMRARRISIDDGDGHLGGPTVCTVSISSSSEVQ